MNYQCLELEDCFYQPQNTIQIKDFWIVPLGLIERVPSTKNFKLTLVQNKPIRDIRDETYFFVLTYQFLFSIGEIYYFYATARSPKRFELSGQNILEIEKKIKNRYDSIPYHTVVDFKQIGVSLTGLPIKVDFEVIYNRIIENYENDEKFIDIFSLFLHTVGYKDRLYGNLFQKISQLQTVFETIIGKPKTRKCPECKKDIYEEEWPSFLTRRLKEKGIRNEEDIEFVINIKKFLNKHARVKYIHNSILFDPLQKDFEDFKNGHLLEKMISRTHGSGQSTYKTDVFKSIKKDPKELATIDWVNICGNYQHIVKLLIFLEYLA